MKGTDENRHPMAKDSFEELFRHASARSRPAEEVEAAIRTNINKEWRSVTAKKRSFRRVWTLAAAASLMLAAVTAVIVLKSPVETLPARTVAQVEILTGTVMSQLHGAPAGQLDESVPIHTGQQLTTRSNSRLAIRWQDDSSVRLDQNTTIIITGLGEIQLKSGHVYIDAEVTPVGADPVSILTPAGRVQHMGTQYITAVSKSGTSVSVRQGKVQITGNNAIDQAAAGEQLQISRDGNKSIQSVLPYDELWQWTQSVAPGFSFHGRSVSDFLDWISRESGLSVQFDTPGIEQLVRQTQLRGQVDMEPMKALAIVMRTSDLKYEIREGSIHVSGSNL